MWPAGIPAAASSWRGFAGSNRQGRWSVKRLIIAVCGLFIGLGGVPGGVLAQAPIVYDDASGDSGTCTVSGPPSDQVVMCSDLRPGHGAAVTSPGLEATKVAADTPPPPEPTPEASTAPESDDTTVASATDQDADNYADDLEPGLGLDPTNPDTDADGVADGDEITIYGTDPLAADTDGDGATDGKELFWTHTDPLVWDDLGADGGEAGEG
jgi:hypothetical protein